MKSRSLLATRASVVLAFLLLTACASDNEHMRLYSGNERPSEEIATLLALESVEVDSINGQHVPGIPRVIRMGDRRFDLLPGGYDIVAYYDQVWQLNSSDEETIRSESQRVRVHLEAGHTYRLEHRHAMDIDDARLLAGDFKLSVIDLSSGDPIQLAVQSRPAVVKTPLVVNPIPGGGGGGGVQSTPIAVDAPTEESSRAVPALELLKFWWQRASPEERERFRGWTRE